MDTCFWPLYEVEEGQYRLNYEPEEKLPIEEWLRPQGRFSHLFEKENRFMIDRLQKEVDERWKRILSLCDQSTSQAG